MSLAEFEVSLQGVLLVDDVLEVNLDLRSQAVLRRNPNSGVFVSPSHALVHSVDVLPSQACATASLHTVSLSWILSVSCASPVSASDRPCPAEPVGAA